MTSDQIRSKWPPKINKLLFFFLHFSLLFLQVSLLNFVFLASWAFALPYSQYRPLASSVCTVWTCVIIVCKMLYQLKSINPPSYSKNCSMVIRIRVISRAGSYWRVLQHVVSCCRRLSYGTLVVCLLFCLLFLLMRFSFLCQCIFSPQPESYSEAQRTEMQDSVLYKELVEPAHWVGLRKCDDLLEYLRVRGTKYMHF